MSADDTRAAVEAADAALERYAASTAVQAPPELAQRVLARIAREPRTTPPRGLLRALLSLSPSAVRDGFARNLDAARGRLAVPAVVRAQALALVAALVVSVGALGAAGAVLVRDTLDRSGPPKPPAVGASPRAPSATPTPTATPAPTATPTMTPVASPVPTGPREPAVSPGAGSTPGAVPTQGPSATPAVRVDATPGPGGTQPPFPWSTDRPRPTPRADRTQKPRPTPKADRTQKPRPTPKADRTQKPRPTPKADRTQRPHRTPDPDRTPARPLRSPRDGA